MKKAYQYTQNIHDLFGSYDSQLKTFYCREDYQMVISQYKKASIDAKLFKWRKLDEMCVARELDVAQLLGDPALLQSIPTRQELQEQLLTIFYDLCRATPSSAAYMERIVRNLAPAYKDDPVRVAILKKYVLGAGVGCQTYDTAAIIGWAMERMSAAEKAAYALATDQEKLARIVEHLDDSIFCREHLVTELTPREILQLIQKQVLKQSKMELVDKTGGKENFSGFFADERTLSRKTREAYTAVAQVLNIRGETEGDFSVFLESILHRWQEAKLTPAEEDVLTQFVVSLEADIAACLKKIYYVSRTGKICAVFELYDQSKKDARKKKKGDTWKMLIVCNDLAAGNFKTSNGQTRVNLYHFAMMFGMTVAFSASEFDPERDIRKNLFEDYYCDNLTRFLQDDSLDPRITSSWEKEPSGDGINFKNFAEVIYLYYLCKDDPALTPGMRIDRAEEKIQACLKCAPSQRTTHLGRGTYTQVYRDTFADVIRGAEEDQLIRLVLEAYPIEETGHTKTQYAAEMNTAYAVALETLEELETGVEYMATALAEQERQKITDQYVEDTKFSSDFMFEWKLATLLRERYAADEGFIRLLDNLDRRLSAEFEWIGIKKKDILICLLQALYLHTSAGRPINMERLRPLLQKTDVTITGSLIAQCMDLLGTMGFDVVQYSGQEESLVSWERFSFGTDVFMEGLQGYLAGCSANKKQKALLESLPDRLRAYEEQWCVVNLREVAAVLGEEEQTLQPLAEQLKTLGLPIEIDCSYGILLSWPDQETPVHFSEDAIKAYSEQIPRIQQKQVVGMLKTMKHCADSTCLMRLKNLKKLTDQKKLSASLRQIADAVQELRSINESLQKKGFDESLFCLGRREYDNSMLNDVIARIRNRYYVNEELVRTMLMDILDENPCYERKVTRTMFLAVYTSYYVSLLPDTYGLDSFQDVYEDFTSSVNPILEECRFQTLHEKNVLDLYIILSLYFYIIENGKE